MVTAADRESRIKGAILGMYVGDALAMPVHWYYDRQALERDYGQVRGYLAPKNPHPDSILWRSTYTPINTKADILHGQERFWGRAGVHYHQFLEAGENTLNLKLCTLLLNSLLENNGYNADAYLADYIAFLTTAGSHRDTYVEEYHRHFFNNFSSGKPPRACGVMEKHISGIIGMVPLAVFYVDDPDLARRAAFEHLGHTHLGERMVAACEFLMDVLLPVLSGEGLSDVITDKVRRQDNPLLGHPLVRWLDDPDEIVVGRRLSSACYVEDALPAIAYLALKYHDDAARGLIANTNLGGDNAGRGAVLGALLGAANGHGAFPESWIKGLRHPPPEELIR
ncbi:MAG: ADP-ribosylglycohydrolase family protein [Deltaproteobacteria bacterium]|nr:ADP-ribosylglycohydrolase family protein [Deltaproteobacteria bacterium]